MDGLDIAYTLYQTDYYLIECYLNLFEFMFYMLPVSSSVSWHV